MCWRLTLRAKVSIALLLVFGAAGCVFNLYGFLAVTDRLECHTLVVEGWLPPGVVSGVVAEIRNSDYSTILCTGGPVRGAGANATQYDTAAHVAFSRLAEAGIQRDRLVKVADVSRQRDRTFGSALVLRAWFKTNSVPAPFAFNVITEGAHARRTRLLFQKAFGDTAKIGVIAVPSVDYPGDKWWRYSDGVRDVLGETIAYLYARLIFRSSDSSP